MSAAAQYCADCKASRPRYASTTLGIWLCNRCYGIHRNVGAHVTRTKCVGLDSWSTQELHRMKSIGNERAASYWESQVPDGYIRPSPKSTNEEVEKWIRDKYEKKLYCPRDSPPPSVPELPEKPTSSTPHRYKQEQGVNFNIPLPRMKVIPTSSESGVGGDEDEFGNFMQAPS
ncbi:hypothetical protein Mp_7g05000 [Marchantia polymorpha subsp. ruderalis]|uniref:Arf-GAP domain-containing protein n=2 Tax=Marchantia polymorpha TaxID=3197 RepID=A0AAF6BW98_MARPO|nr:hypothetical protein MARPO_0062s0026 [Marchantia polymorpha]BBN16282.1 hypothetical protein Mp_7g05000 [Marchantia polymorpha subsp. ruderalis]|eukprot:PTQ36600.1 hypothetical protein MARPO_0062s0026 [Marchantia polymorpha]